MELHPIRLSPGDDLRAALDAALAAARHDAGFVVAGIGSLSRAQLRMAGAGQPTLVEGDIEILTLSGTLSRDGSHLHMSMADAAGRVLGGHVAPGCTVRTTAEVLVAFLPGHVFSRLPDPLTGYRELSIAAKAAR
jgi:predicted DNA-binding protein with PD1-like motif